jgi:hypothetical protein
MSSHQLAACVCWFLLHLLFDPEEGGDIFLGNVGLSPNTRLYNPEGRTPELYFK